MSKYQFLYLKDEKEFESLINDLCNEKYGIEFQVYGRKGQKQSGIDGLSFSKDEKQIVFQCKNKIVARDDKKIRAELLKDIEVEVKSAIAIFNNIDTFIFANSFKQDTVLQDKATELTTQYKFTVIVWSWEEIEGLLEKYSNVAKHYYSYLFDKNILSEDDIKQRFQENSVTLLSSKNLYIENSFIEMPEIKKINNFIDSEDDLLVLTGKAGIGKTAILSKIQSNLIENKVTYLSIKSDKFDIENKESLSKFFGVENILHSIKQLARKEKVIVLIDQLDALSLTMSSNSKTINIILEFIEQLKDISNVKVIVSIREYDLKNDPLFKNIENSNIIHIQLLSFECIQNRIKSFTKESMKLNNTLIELLRTPLHLSIFIELYPNNNSCISIKTLQGLYNEFWKQKVQDNSIRNNIVKLLNLIVQEMNKKKKIEISKLKFADNFYNELSLLFSKGILKEENKKISFFHQTFYDYVFARDFAQKDISLYKYILTTNQDLSIREQFKQIIQFLRGTDEDKYLSELNDILYSTDIRFHIKLLLVSYLGSLENPINEEFEFIKKLFEDEQNYEKYFIESWISSDWLIYFKDIDFFNSKNLKKYNLHYKLETFINKETNLVLEILNNCSCEADIKDESIMLSLESLDNWNDYSFKILKKYHTLLYEEYGKFRIERIYKKIYSFNQEYAINLFFNYLDIRIEKVDYYEGIKLLNHDWHKIFEFLVEKNEIKIFKKLLESIQKISNKFKGEDSKEKFLITDQIFYSLMWKFENNHDSTWDLYLKTLKKISQLALDNKDYFLELMRPYQSTNYLSLITFLIFGYAKNPKEYKNEILSLFTNLKLLEEMRLDYNIGYEFLTLLRKIFRLFDEIEQEKIFKTIIQINPKWENKWFVGKWDKKAVHRGTLRGLQKYKFLFQLDIEYIQKFNYIKEFQELQRKFPDYKLEKPKKSGNIASFVTTPLSSKTYEKMSLNNWLQSMRVFNGIILRITKYDYLRGNLVEHSREFEKKVTKNSDKFFNLLIQLKAENVHPKYLSAGLSGLIASNYEENKVSKIIHLYSDIDDRWLKRTILRAIKYLLIKDKFDDSLIDILEANKNILDKSLVREDNKLPTIQEQMSSSINSFEGDFAELLPLIYKYVFKNIDSRERVLSMVAEVIDKNIDFVIFGLLGTLDNIKTVDKKLFTKLLLNLVEKDKTGQVSIYSLENFRYLYIYNFISKEELISYIKKCISFIKILKDDEDSDYVKNLGMYLFYYYLNENDKIFKKLLNDAIDSNNQVIDGALGQIFWQSLQSKDEAEVKKSKQFILRFKNNKENDYSYTSNLSKMNGLKFIQNDFKFIKSLSKSLNIKKDIKSFIEYLQNEYYLDTSISEKIFELLEELIEKIDSLKDIEYYDSSLLIEFILELNTRTKSEDNKKKILNLIDKFLKIDRLRSNTKSAIE